MERVGFMLKVKKDRLAEYRLRHQAVWPDMLQALSETGWHNYSLFISEDGIVFGYLETEDFAAALAGMDGTEVNGRWQTEMADFFELDGAHPDKSLMRLDEYFHLA